MRAKRIVGNLKKSFLNKISVDEKTGCWNWTASKDRKGYGRIRFNSVGLKAHRVSYQLFKGDIPQGEGFHGTCVLHKCDNPSCVNPEHLFLGSNLDNILDMITKGRYSKGESRWNAKLSESDVISIINDPRGSRKLSKAYNIAPSHVRRIKAGKRWKHLKNGKFSTEP